MGTNDEKKRRQLTMEPVDEGRDIEPPAGEGWSLVSMCAATVPPVFDPKEDRLRHGTVYAVLLWEKPEAESQ